MPISSASNTAVEEKIKALPRFDADVAPNVHHVIRTISATGLPNAGAVPAVEIDSYLATFLADGWKLFASHYLGMLPEGYTMLWIFVR